MAIVPSSRQNQVRAVPQAPPDQKYLAMAAAMMHSQGRLFNPSPLGPEQSFEKTPNQRVKEGHDAVDKGQDLFDQSYGNDVYRYNSKTGVRRDVVT